MTTPPATPPPAPPSQVPPKLWSFLKEIFFNRTSLLGFVRRHKFSAFLCLTNTTLFVIGMLLLEFNFDNQNRLVKMAVEADRNKGLNKAYEECRAEVVTISAIHCNGGHKPTTTTSQPHPRKPPRPDSSIADKLNAIRDGNS